MLILSWFTKFFSRKLRGRRGNCLKLISSTLESNCLTPTLMLLKIFRILWIWRIGKMQMFLWLIFSGTILLEFSGKGSNWSLMKGYYRISSKLLINSLNYCRRTQMGRFWWCRQTNFWRRKRKEIILMMRDSIWGRMMMSLKNNMKGKGTERKKEGSRRRSTMKNLSLLS